MKMTRAAGDNGIFSVAILCIVMLLAACGRDNDESASDEGTRDAPVILTVGTAHTGSISKFGTSYYSFVAASDRPHRISLTSTRSDLGWELYSNGFYLIFILQCDNSERSDDEVCTTSTNLTAGTTYYVVVDEYDNNAGTYQIQVDAM